MTIPPDVLEEVQRARDDEAERLLAALMEAMR
jgi:hypothetical protein